MNNIKSQLVHDLKRDEGFRLKPYLDTVGKLSIGIGRNLDDVGINENEAEIMLNNDIERAIKALDQFYPAAQKLDAKRYAVLINMTFNMGLETLKQFKKFFAALDKQDYETASQEMLNSRWAKQVGKRAIRLARVMRESK